MLSTPRRRRSIALLLALLLTAAPAPPARAQAQTPSGPTDAAAEATPPAGEEPLASLGGAVELPAEGTPILVDAADARIDRRRDQLVFTDIEITQGSLSVKARLAEGSGLSFENSDWTFSEDVRLASAGALIEADRALLTFRDNELVSARLRGAPVAFQRESRRVPGQVARGRAQRVDYEVAMGTIRLSGDAWVCEGGNEITSEVIVYEIAEERVLAESSEGEGRVRILIQPNAEEQESDCTGFPTGGATATGVEDAPAEDGAASGNAPDDGDAAPRGTGDAAPQGTGDTVPRGTGDAAP